MYNFSLSNKHVPFPNGSKGTLGKQRDTVKIEIRVGMKCKLVCVNIQRKIDLTMPTIGHLMLRSNEDTFANYKE